MMCALTEPPYSAVSNLLSNNQRRISVKPKSNEMPLALGSMKKLYLHNKLFVLESY